MKSKNQQMIKEFKTIENNYHNALTFNDCKASLAELNYFQYQLLAVRGKKIKEIKQFVAHYIEVLENYFEARYLSLLKDAKSMKDLTIHLDDFGDTI